jgi:hypothetical protein
VKRADQAGQAQEMVGVHVGEEDVLEGKRDPETHHLPLCSFAAIDENCLAFPNESEGTDASLNSGARGGGAEKSNEQRHRGI